MCVWIFFEIPIRVILYPEVNIRDCRLEMPKSSGKDMAIKFYLEKTRRHRIYTSTSCRVSRKGHESNLNITWRLQVWHVKWRLIGLHAFLSQWVKIARGLLLATLSYSKFGKQVMQWLHIWCRGKKVQRHGSKRPINLSTKEKSPELSALCRAIWHLCPATHSRKKLQDCIALFWRSTLFPLYGKVWRWNPVQPPCPSPRRAGWAPAWTAPSANLQIKVQWSLFSLF